MRTFWPFAGGLALAAMVAAEALYQRRQEALKAFERQYGTLMVTIVANTEAFVAALRQMEMVMRELARSFETFARSFGAPDATE